MNKCTPLPPIERLCENLDYHPDTGLLWWKKRGRGRVLGAPIGTPNSEGYLRVLLDGRRMYIHRVGWAMFHGQDPFGLEIDHANGDTRDNRICNLRAVTPQQQNRNLGIKSTNTSGVPGVGWSRKNGKWYAYITHNGVMKNLGLYALFDDAVQARLAAAEKLHGEFAAHLSRPDIAALVGR